MHQTFPIECAEGFFFFLSAFLIIKVMKAAHFSVQQQPLTTRMFLGRERAIVGATQFDEGEFFQGKERNCTDESAPCAVPFKMCSSEPNCSEKNGSGQVMPCALVLKLRVRHS